MNYSDCKFSLFKRHVQGAGKQSTISSAWEESLGASGISALLTIVINCTFGELMDTKSKLVLKLADYQGWL